MAGEHRAVCGHLFLGDYQPQRKRCLGWSSPVEGLGQRVRCRQNGPRGLSPLRDLVLLLSRTQPGPKVPDSRPLSLPKCDPARLGPSSHVLAPSHGVGGALSGGLLYGAALGGVSSPAASDLRQCSHVSRLTGFNLGLVYIWVRGKAEFGLGTRVGGVS